MNYLAHLYLAGPDQNLILGNIIADFVRGSVDKLDFSPEIKKGIVLHRHIDSFADDHAIAKISRERFIPQHRRYARVVLDIAWDHFLSIEWSRFAKEPLPKFTARMYSILSQSQGLLPLELQCRLPYIIEDDLFGSYGDLETVEFVLNRLASYLSRPNKLAEGMVDIRQNYSELREDFLKLFPKVVDFCNLHISAKI